VLLKTCSSAMTRKRKERKAEYIKKGCCTRPKAGARNGRGRQEEEEKAKAGHPAGPTTHTRTTV
jgi:hypothetical protein